MLNLLRSFAGKETTGTPIKPEEPFDDIIPDCLGIEGCRLIDKMDTIGKGNLEWLLDHWLGEYNELMHSQNRTYEAVHPVSQKVIILIEAIRMATERPLLSIFRGEEFFEIGETVMVFKDNKFVQAKIVELREADPRPDMFIGLEFSDGYYAPYAFQRPDVLKIEDFETMKNDPEFFDKIWLANARAEGWADFNASIFAAALFAYHLDNQKS